MKDEVMAKYAALKATIESNFYDEAFAEGVASVPAPVEGGMYDQEAMDLYATKKVEEAMAALPADETPFSREEMEAVQAELALVKSDDEADKAAIAKANAKLEAIKVAMEA